MSGVGHFPARLHRVLLYSLDCYSSHVSVKRSYSSTKREAHARETRLSILDAAHELFVATGYAATTIQAIALRAGVAVQTVYAVFGNKRELLRQPPLDHEEEAAATLYGLYGPHVADMLMGDYGWSPKRYEQWLARMIRMAVIRDAKSTRT